MSTSSVVFRDSKNLLVRTVLYLFGSVVTTSICFVFLSAVSLPAIIGGMIIPKSTIVVYLALMGITGLSFYFGQLVLREEPPSRDDVEFDISWSEILVISISYYSLLNVTTVALGMFLFAQGHVQMGLLAVLLYGPVDIELARKVNASPITIIVATAYALGYTFGLVTSTVGESIEPRQVATLSLSRFKRGRRRIGGV